MLVAALGVREVASDCLRALLVQICNFTIQEYKNLWTDYVNGFAVRGLASSQCHLFGWCVKLFGCIGLRVQAERKNISLFTCASM